MRFKIEKQGRNKGQKHDSSALTPSETPLERKGQLVADTAIAWAKRVGRKFVRPVAHPTYRGAAPNHYASQIFPEGKMG